MTEYAKVINRYFKNRFEGDSKMQSGTNKRLLTVEEFAMAIGKRPQTVRQKIWRREIPFLRIGRSVRFTQEMVDKILEGSLVPAIQR